MNRYNYVYPPEMRPAWAAWIAEAWTDRDGTIHGLDPRGPKAMLEEVVLTPAQLSRTLENLTALKIDRTLHAFQYEVVKEVFTVLWTTANASNLRNVRVPRHAFTSQQWDWVRATHAGTEGVVSEISIGSEVSAQVNFPAERLHFYRRYIANLESELAQDLLGQLDALIEQCQGNFQGSVSMRLGTKEERHWHTLASAAWDRETQKAVAAKGPVQTAAGDTYSIRNASDEKLGAMLGHVKEIPLLHGETIAREELLTELSNAIQARRKDGGDFIAIPVRRPIWRNWLESAEKAWSGPPLTPTRYYDLSGATAKQLETMHAHIAAEVRCYGMAELQEIRDSLLRSLGDRADKLRGGVFVSNIPLKHEAWDLWLREAEAHWRAKQNPIQEWPPILGVFTVKAVRLPLASEEDGTATLHPDDGTQGTYFAVRMAPKHLPELGSQWLLTKRG